MMDVRTPFGIALVACTVLAGCGQIGEPLYPALKIAIPISDLSAVERGDKIEIHFTIPAFTIEGLAFKEIGGIELRVGPTPAGNFQADTWVKGAEQVVVQTPTQPGPVDVAALVKDFVGKDVTVAVRIANAKGRMSDWSNFYPVKVEPPLAPPAALTVQAVPEGVRFTWKAAGETSFRIFRKEAEEKQPSVLGTSDKPEYLDTTSAYGKTYAYSVQAIRDKNESDVVQSSAITPQDVFAPRVPTALTASVGAGSVELAWDRNTESDFKEYRVFRSEENGPFVQIAAGLDGPVYSDHSVVSGKHYRYRVSAVDQVGNASGLSEPVEVSVP